MGAGQYREPFNEQPPESFRQGKRRVDQRSQSSDEKRCDPLPSGRDRLEILVPEQRLHRVGVDLDARRGPSRSIEQGEEGRGVAVVAGTAVGAQHNNLAFDPLPQLRVVAFAGGSQKRGQ